MNTLLIVDPQYDFIEGGKLPVEGGKKALDNIAEAIKCFPIDQIVITQDWHPADHCSFVHFGGNFPEHCVQNSYGAKIYEPILDAINDRNIEIVGIYKKGKYDEEFTSIGSVTYRYRSTIAFETSENDELIFGTDDNIIVCGLAGDICVLNTLNALNVLDAPFKLLIFPDGIASLDGGSKLKEYITKNKIDEVHGIN